MTKMLTIDTCADCRFARQCSRVDGCDGWGDSYSSHECCHPKGPDLQWIDTYTVIHKDCPLEDAATEDAEDAREILGIAAVIGGLADTLTDLAEEMCPGTIERTKAEAAELAELLRKERG